MPEFMLSSSRKNRNILGGLKVNMSTFHDNKVAYFVGELFLFSSSIASRSINFFEYVHYINISTRVTTLSKNEKQTTFCYSH